MKEIDFKKEIEAMKYFANKNAVSVFDIVCKECRIKEEDLRREGIMTDMLNQEIKELQKEKQIEICDGCKKQNNCNHKELIYKDGCKVNDCDYFQNISTDAKKQIEEMALTIQSCSDIEQSYYDSEWHSVDVYNGLAKTLYSEDFRIVNEDSIVITREEYEKLKLELAIEKKRADESYTQKEVEEIIASKERIKSKETAEKIMQDLKPLLEGFVHTDTGENLYVYKCKQFGVEIKED